MRNFRNLEVWKSGIELVKEVYKLSNNFPDAEKFSLTNQIRRSAVSIPSNIAEGASRKSETEFSRFIQISMGSSFELETQLIIANNLNYIQVNDFNNLILQLNTLQKRLNSLNRAISN